MQQDGKNYVTTQQLEATVRDLVNATQKMSRGFGARKFSRGELMSGEQGSITISAFSRQAARTIICGKIFM